MTMYYDAAGVSLVGLIASGLGLFCLFYLVAADRIRADLRLRLRLHSTLRSVLAHDFPAAFPVFLPTTTALLSASNTRNVREEDDYFQRGHERGRIMTDMLRGLAPSSLRSFCLRFACF
ncbi:hypothetical protein BDZ89DRAFT_554359 [Hymenopellis radicata]|nr:hypothetical protein BDZ89DRAFT_554359 [Hymenopellis radicata]